MHDEHVVGGAARVELDAVGTHLAGAREGRERVLRRGGRRATVTEDERPGVHHRAAYEHDARDRNTFH